VITRAKGLAMDEARGRFARHAAERGEPQRAVIGDAPILSGAPAPWASTDSGGTAASRSARCWPACSATRSASPPPSGAVAALTGALGVVVAMRMHETHQPEPAAMRPLPVERRS
jgi:hypothetical protein